MSNKLNPFEEQLKKAANSHEVPYDAKQWEALEKKLDASSPVGSSFAKWGMAAVAALVIGFGIYQYSDKPSNSPISEQIKLNNTEEQNKVTPELKLKTENQNVNQGNQGLAVKPESELIKIGDSKTKQHNAQDVNQQVVKPVEEFNQDRIVTETKPEKTEVKELTEVTNEKNRVDTKPLPIIVIEKTTLCAGVEFHATVTPETNDMLFWDLGNGEIIESNELNYTYFESGEFSISVSLSKGGESSEKQKMLINPKPDAAFTIKENLERGMIPVVYFASETGGEKAYMWQLSDGFSMNGEGLSHTFRKKGDYEVSLRVVNKYGCFWTNYQPYHVSRDFNLLAPNSFSPNGDGINETWFPKALTTGYYNFDLKIYDRLGNVVFETKDPEAVFNGHVNGNTSANGEAFIWRASVVDPGGLRQEFSGTFVSYY